MKRVSIINAYLERHISKEEKSAPRFKTEEKNQLTVMFSANMNGGLGPRPSTSDGITFCPISDRATVLGFVETELIEDDG